MMWMCESETHLTMDSIRNSTQAVASDKIYIDIRHSYDALITTTLYILKFHSTCWISLPLFHSILFRRAEESLVLTSYNCVCTMIKITKTPKVLCIVMTKSATGNAVNIDLSCLHCFDMWCYFGVVGFFWFNSLVIKIWFQHFWLNLKVCQIAIHSFAKLFA